MRRAVLIFALVIAACTAAPAEDFDQGTPTSVTDFPDAASAAVRKLSGDHVILDSHVNVVKGENVYTALIMARGGDSYTNLQVTVDKRGQELARKLLRDPDAPKLVSVERKDGKRVETFEGGQTVEVTEDEVDAAMAKAADEAKAQSEKPEAAKAEAAKPKAAKPEAAKPEATKTDAAKPTP